jgi:drug/metabolite transporter (DMT)-like permease
MALARAYLSERIERLQQIGIAVGLFGVAAVSAASA